MFKTTSKKIRRWEEAGIISSEQAAELIFFEHARRNFHKMTSQIALGFILLGVIAVFVSNWAVFAIKSKVFIELAAMGVLAGLSYRYYVRERMLHFEWCIGALFSIALCFLVTLDYWYQTTGEPYWMIAFWSILTLPLLYLVRGRALLFIWSLLALVGLNGILLDWAGASDVAAVNILLILPFLLGSFSLLGPRHMKHIFALEGATVFAVILFSLSFMHDVQPRESLWVFFPLTVGFAFWFVVRNLKSLTAVESITWLSLMGIYGALIVINFGYMHQASLLLNFMVVLLCILGLILAAYIAHLKRAHQVVKLLLGLGILRAVILYYEALGGLLFTGVGLMLTGSIILLGLFMTKKGYRWLRQGILE